MNLDLRLRRNACLVAILGMAVLGLAEMNPAWLLLIAAASVVGWTLERRDAPLQIGPAGLNLILLGAVGFAAIDYFFLSRGWIVTLAHFLLLVQMAKLLLPKSDRDFGQIYLISLMNVAVAAIVAADVVFAAAFVLYSGAVIRGLILYHFRRELTGASHVYLPEGEETARPTREPRMQRVVSPRFFAVLTTVVATAWLANAVFFVLVPRLPMRLFNLGPAGWFQRLTGFSESVRLGDIGRVLENSSTVMHVVLRDGEGTVLRGERDLYFRGMTYQHYDGREWQRTGPALEGVNIFLPEGGLPHPPVRRDDASRPDVIYQDVRLEPIGTSSLFALQGALAVSGPPGARVQVQPNFLDQTWVVSAAPGAPLRYRAWSIIDPSERLYPPAMMTRGGMRPLVLPPLVRQAYLQLPDDLAARVKELAGTIAPADAAATPREGARRIEEYLKTHMSYTLDLRPNPDVECVEDFLFNTKRGHCEYFASSMVVLLRAAGVPARLVTGFHGGEWNEVGEWYVVKQSDAHAWVEAWADGEGWTRFDPTPAAERDRQAAGARFGPFGRWLDYFRSSWMNYVVQYDQEQQSAVFQTTRRVSARIREAVSHAMSRVGALLRASWDVLTNLRRLSTTEGALIFAGTLLVSTTLVLTARWALRRLLKRLRSEYDRRRALHLGRVHVAFYQDLLRELKRRGFLRGAHETPLEFAANLAGPFGPAQPRIREITDAYYRVRFGGASLSRDEEKRLRALLDSLRAAPICRV